MMISLSLNLTNEYNCHCDSRYVGRTSQRLQDRIKQHVPQWSRQQLTRSCRSQPHRSCKRKDTKPDCHSAIGQQLSENDQCALNYDNKQFSILATIRRSFHLNLFEAVYIKSQRPVICRQKVFVDALKLFDNRGIGPLAALSITFAIAKSFFGVLYNTSAIIGSS